MSPMTHSVSSSPVAITAYECVSACGMSKTDLYGYLVKNQSALGPISLFELPFDTVVGEVPARLPGIDRELQAYRTRNAQLALATLTPALRNAVLRNVELYGPSRVGVVLGTSTSGLYESEAAYAYFRKNGRMPDDFNFICRHAYQATAQFLQLELGLTGPCYAVSTACSSSTKALAAGQRLINAGICDAVLAGGVDTLCRLTLLGFQSLELVSRFPCTPMDANRKGINIGEGAGLLLLEKSDARSRNRPHLLAVGESSDAHHMSAPHPEGKGAALAMQGALVAASLKPEAVDYINLHATATPLNDRVEAQAVARVFQHQPPCSGTKGITGHTLGAAGALEAVVSLLALERGFIPGTCGLRESDPALNCNLLKDSEQGQSLRTVMSNSFGFGGNNASAIFSLHR